MCLRSHRHFKLCLVAALVALGAVLLVPPVGPALLSVGGLNRWLPELSHNVAKQIFIDVDDSCDHLARLGNVGDGGWVVCLEDVTINGELQPLSQGPAPVVYSFGIRDDWSFDRSAAALGFEVHSFDPTVRSSAKPRHSNIFFHPWALASVNRPPRTPADHNYTVIGKPLRQSWLWRTLPSIMEELGHEQIHILKADIEWSEWGVLESILPTILWSGSVKQLVMEIHFEDRYRANPAHVKTLERIREAGFHVFHREDNVQWGRLLRLSPFGAIVRCCINVSWRWRGGR